jgi:hypothetical protein
MKTSPSKAQAEGQPRANPPSSSGEMYYAFRLSLPGFLPINQVKRKALPINQVNKKAQGDLLRGKHHQAPKPSSPSSSTSRGSAVSASAEGDAKIHSIVDSAIGP